MRQRGKSWKPGGVRFEGMSEWKEYWKRHGWWNDWRRREWILAKGKEGKGKREGAPGETEVVGCSQGWYYM